VSLVRKSGIRRTAVALSACACVIFFAASHFAPAAEDAGAQADKLTKQLASSEFAVRRDAAYQLGKMGVAAKPAVPALIKALQDDDRQVWAFAVAALAEIGPEAREAIPALIADLARQSRGGRDRDRRQIMVRSAYALSRIGTEAVPPLIAALESEDSGARAGAARALGGMGAQAVAAIPALRANFGHGDLSVRQEAIDALALIGAAAVAPVSEALSWNEPLQRTSAALTLAQLGPLAKTSEPALTQLLAKETDAGVRGAALTALATVSADPTKCLPVLVAAVKDDSEVIRHAAINAIGGSRALRRPAVAPLAALLKDGNVTVRQRAAHALGRLGPDAADALPALLAATRAAEGDPIFADALAQIGPAALPALLKALKESDATNSAWVLRALRGFGAPAVPLLVEALQQPNPAVRVSAAATLGAMGRDASAAIRPLFSLVTTDDAATQAAVLRALTALRAEPAQLKPTLQQAMKNPAPSVRKAAAAGLAALGETTAIGVDGLVEMLGDDDAVSRSAAVQALGQMGAKAAPAVPALIARLGDLSMQMAVMDALGKIGPASTPAVPRLLELSETGANDVKATALTAFAGIGHAAAAALPQIYAGLRDPSSEVRAPAVLALAGVESDEGKIIAALTAAVGDESGRIRRPSAQALTKYRERARPAVPGLVAMLERDGDRPVALDALKAIGGGTVPDWLKALAVKDPKVRVFACESLAKLGPEAKDATARLRELLNGQPQPVQDAARTALAKIELVQPAP
jgi:HEAT repeat protein